MITQETGLPLEGIKWFKNKGIDKQLTMKFLKTWHQEVNCEKGVPRSWVKDKWCNLLFILQKCVTCEGRYAINFMHHIGLLFHFTGDKRINVPDVLLIILQKMSQGVCKAVKNSRDNLYHNGLIKLLIVDELGVRNDNWDGFLQQNELMAVSKEPNAQPNQIIQEIEDVKLDVVFSLHPRKSRKKKMGGETSIAQPFEAQTPAPHQKITCSMEKAC